METILSHLRTLELLAAAHKVLGVVDLDPYAPELNFVFGQALPRGWEAIIALARLREEFYGLVKLEMDKRGHFC